MAVHTRTETIKREVAQSVTCDRCQQTYSYKDDVFETQEFSRFDIVGGYGSVWGDSVRVTADLCQHCMHDLLSEIAVVRP